MTGFFTKKQTQSKTRPDGKKYTCISCGLYKDANSPRMAPYGNFKKGILNIGEAPGASEDRIGKPWQGRTGRLLMRTYQSLGIDLFEDCLNINACHCRPINSDGSNRAPTAYEIDCCRKTIFSVIKQYKPKLIVLLGNSALYSFLKYHWNKDIGNITKWRGWAIPDQDYQVTVCPVFHPSYVERANGDEILTVWKNDLLNAFNHIGKFKKYKEPEIEIIEDLSPLKEFMPGMYTFDYETTGIKPHAIGHRIVCASIAISENFAYTFMIPKNKKDRQPFIDFLTSPAYQKVAHNMKYEKEWSEIRLKTKVENWHWDSMIAAHILDNRERVTSLKFQTYVNFGISDYDSEISPYLRAKNKGANSINTIFELLKLPGGKEKLLKYCGYDSIFGHRLTLLQKEIINGVDDLPF